MKKLAIFASGSGSNFQAIVDAVKAGKLDAEVSLLVCDKPGAFCIERASTEEIPSFVFNPKEYASKADYETELYEKLKELEIDIIVLAGYMRLIGPVLLTPYEGKIVNIHPSLLPAFPGKDAIGQALAAKVKETGVTIHFVDSGMDTGPIVVQQSVSISETETRESLQAKIQKIEHELYPSVLQKLLHS
ncbi:formyltetrahydrofolate-dependent phosphoribosylglycinamide formyltransferase [Bacillus oleivorans]|uniref:Phosphoribosylglycinamide formyltransferase n=1 Tax=Bacillus oleivorans TaxID=1448271 RepID=A0A285CQ66_9BACI|nr:phosphoribosylglycinamide formyltransferase [Bacillus oleivorans]SNX69671.1 formyltetrahydrofolate-dependent phosphoribosylglycinamide formyltransferase [Bacillus oleivorans]